MSQPIIMTRHNSRKIPGVTVLAVKGSIDSETAPLFEKELESLLSQGSYRLLVDLAEVEYISSAGVGVFVGMLQEFRDHAGGDIKACRVSRKIMKVLESIGLDDMLDFYEDEAALKTWTAAEEIKEALDHFTLTASSGDIYCGEDFTLRVEARDANQAVLRDYRGGPGLSVSDGMVFPVELAGFDQGAWEGPVKVTAAGNLALTLKDNGHTGTLKISVEARADKAAFPIKINCSTCQAEILVKAPDLYRCEECDETFRVDEWGHRFTLRAGSTARRRKSRYKGIEIKINADVNYLGIVRQTISGICEKEGMDEVTTNSVALAIEEILLNIIEHGNDFDPWQILRLKLEFQKKQAKIRIRDYGDPFDVTKSKNVSVRSSIAKGAKRGVGGLLVNQLMDHIKYESLPTYNQLTMIKRYGTVEE